MRKKLQQAAFVPMEIPAPDCQVEASEFTWVGPDTQKQEAIARASISYWKDAMRRLRKNKTAMFCIVVLLVIILMAFIVPMVSPYTISEQHLTHVNKGLMYRAEEDGHLHIFGTDNLGRDIFTRIWDGGRTSLFIAFTAVLVNLAVDILYGLVDPRIQLGRK